MERKDGRMQELLTLWADRYRRDKAEYQTKLDRMDRRERLFRGSRDIRTVSGAMAKEGATHVRNLVQELIETQVDTNIPQPKVTAVRAQD